MPKPQAVTRRADPKPRPTSGVHSWTKLKNKDINKHYAWISMTDPDQGVDYYLSLGYEPVYASEGGVEPLGGKLARKSGEQIVFRGLLLMECPLERKAQIDNEGPDGDTGQQLADVIESRILDKERGLDPLRGIGMRGKFGAPVLRFEAEPGHNAPILEDTDNG